MGNTSKLCIILFLIFVAIYLLDTCKSVESMTPVEQNTDSNNKANVVVNTSSSGNAYTTTQSVVSTNSAPNEHLISPPGIEDSNKYAPIGSSKVEVDNKLVKDYSDKLAENLAQKDFNVKDFLPQEINEDWFNTDLSKAQNEMDAGTLIDIARFCQGVDTIGQSLKNPSYDIRGNIPNPKITVSPFLNSSYEPDTNLRSWH